MNVYVIRCSLKDGWLVKDWLIERVNSTTWSMKRNQRPKIAGEKKRPAGIVRVEKEYVYWGEGTWWHPVLIFVLGAQKFIELEVFYFIEIFSFSIFPSIVYNETIKWKKRYYVDKDFGYYYSSIGFLSILCVVCSGGGA